MDPWTIALYRIIHYITKNIKDTDVKKPTTVKINKIATWMKEENLKQPAPRNFKELLSLSKKDLYIEYLSFPNNVKTENLPKLELFSKAILQQNEKVKKHVKGSKGVQPLSYEKWSENCVEENLKVFFDYTIKYKALENGSKIPDLTIDGKVQFINYPVRKEKFTKGKDDKYYLAYYLRGELTPNVAMVTVSWKMIDKLYKPLSATLEQAIAPFGKDDNLITFKAKDQIDPLPKEKSDLIYFKFEVAAPKTHAGVVFQCAIDFLNYPVLADELEGQNDQLIFGTYSAIRKMDTKRPVAGGVILVETTKERLKRDFDIIRRFIREKPIVTQPDVLIENFLKSYYYLSEKIVITPDLTYDHKDESVFAGWKEIATNLAGNYLGVFYVEQKNSDLRKEVFRLRINSLGHAGITLASRGLQYHGLVKVDSDSFNLRFTNPEGPDFNFVLRYTQVPERHLGIYFGYLPFRGIKNKFNYGTLFLDKVPDNQNTEGDPVETDADQGIFNDRYKSAVISGDKDVYRKELDSFTEFISQNSELLPDGKMLGMILSEQSPIFNNKSVKDLNLPKHMKYITFRVPEKKKYEEEIYNSMFRFEKCDLTFHNDYKDVKLLSPSNNFNGKVYFNGNVILMILNPVDENEKILYTDNFFTIQLDAHKIAGHKISNVNTLFGTSTWRSDEYIESKMIVLRKADDNDNLPGVYPMGGHGVSPSENEIEALNIQDKKYQGAFSYLCGRLNRHIHVSSGNGKKDLFRPRDTSSREPYIYAALYLIKEINEENQGQLLPKIKSYLNEALMHQFASTHFAGEILDYGLIENNDTVQNTEAVERLREILIEQSDLKKKFSDIPEKLKNVKNTMQELWPFLKN
ncbi:hypothetical protein Dfri01_06810 [Dyadobacter frigoris]|nr:hypothetical protein Dfri01_06810 [Dyadobacter frigoris]